MRETGNATGRILKFGANKKCSVGKEKNVIEEFQEKIVLQMKKDDHLEKEYPNEVKQLLILKNLTTDELKG